MINAGKQKGRWQTKGECMVKGINVAHKLRSCILGHVRWHDRSLHNKLLTCSSISPNVSGACLKIGRTRVPQYLLKRLHSIIKNCIMMSRLRMIFLYRYKILILHKFKCRKYKMYCRTISRPTRVQASVFYRCSV
jgi:hypothetical protein